MLNIHIWSMNKQYMKGIQKLKKPYLKVVCVMMIMLALLYKVYARDKVSTVNKDRTKRRYVWISGTCHIWGYSMDTPILLERQLLSSYSSFKNACTWKRLSYINT